MGADSSEFLGQGCSLEKAECGAGVKFDIQVYSVPGTRYSVKTYSQLRFY